MTEWAASSVISTLWLVNTLIIILSFSISWGQATVCHASACPQAMPSVWIRPSPRRAKTHTHTSVIMWCHAYYARHHMTLQILSCVFLCNKWLKAPRRMANQASDSVWNLHPSLTSLGSPLRVHRQLCNAKWFCSRWWTDSLSFVTFCPAR